MVPAIKIENLSKQYRLGVVGTGTLSHDLKRWWHLARGKEDPYLKIGETNDRSTKGKSDLVWALKDINFEVQKGEILGIIGKNGAGKSTLLKILSKVTGPTTGTITYEGRIGSLLEVGTGFHPELTGRENIYLNGAILGMRKKEIERKFDEIVDFSGCERYIDTPVKRYSSGMTVRLGFAVAAFLEPEILVVDEVLAVGDAEFQKKAIGKMQDVSRNDGRTVLFVSHNMAAVKSLCKYGIILKDGMIFFEGNIDECVSSYLIDGHSIPNYKKLTNDKAFENDYVVVHEIGARGFTKNYEDIIHIDEQIEISIEYSSKARVKVLHTTLHVKDDSGNYLFSTGGGMIDNPKISCKYIAKVVFPSDFFNWGTLYFDLFIIKDKMSAVIVIKDIISLTILNKEKEVGSWMGREPGSIHPHFEWTINKRNEK